MFSKKMLLEIIKKIMSFESTNPNFLGNYYQNFLNISVSYLFYTKLDQMIIKNTNISICDIGQR
jgi:hypothetical protein